MTPPAQPPRILFVCLGNICRSPMAEGAMAMLAKEHGVTLELDSAGTGDWHVGRPPDPRARDTARAHGCDIGHLRARQVSPDDFALFDHIIAMDLENLADLLAMQPEHGGASVSLLLDYADGATGRSVADPYYGGHDGFETIWQDIESGARGLLARLDKAWSAT